MASKLRNLQINTLGSVDTPANQFGKAVLFKRAPQAGGEPVIKQRSKLAETIDKAWKDVYQTVSRFKEIISTTSFYDSESVSTSEYADDPSLLTGDTGEDVEKAAKCASCGAAMKDGKCSSCGVAKNVSTIKEEEGVIKMADTQAGVAAAPDVAAILKNHGDKLPEEVLKALQGVGTLTEQVSTLSKTLETTNSKLESELEKSAEREYLAKAQALPNLPVGETKAFATLLKSIGQKVTAEEFTQLENMLKSANEAIGKGKMFEEIGGAGAVDGTAEAEIDKKAKQMVADKLAKTYEEAYDEVLRNEPALYKRLQKGE